VLLLLLLLLLFLLLCSYSSVFVSGASHGG
jgi:hypothetical protein